MKKNLIFRIILITLILLPITINAGGSNDDKNSTNDTDISVKGNKLFTCNYKANYGVYEDQSYIPIELTVYDNNTITLLNHDPSNSENYRDLIKNSGVGITSPKFFTNNSTGLVLYLNTKASEIYNLAIRDNNYYCPNLYIVKNDYDYYVEFSKDTPVENNEVFITTTPEPKIEDIDDADNVVKEIDSCFYNREVKGLKFSIAFRLFSDTNKKICITPSGEKEMCKLVGNDNITLVYDNGYQYIFEFEKEDFASFFKLNTNKNKIDCPINIYDAFTGTGYYITSDKKKAEDYNKDVNDTEETNHCSSFLTQDKCKQNKKCKWTWFNKENGDGYCTIATNDSDQEVERCEVLPKAIENYIKQALKLIRWGGLVLMIVLGTLDFVKASASDDQDAIKKAGQNFIKRLIAVIILFLLPILVELILFIAGKIGFNFGECYKVSEF